MGIRRLNSAPNLSDTETEDGYNRIKTRVKWDNSIESVTLTQEVECVVSAFRRRPSSSRETCGRQFGDA